MSLSEILFKKGWSKDILQQARMRMNLTSQIMRNSSLTGKDKRVERAVGICKKVVAAYSWEKKRDLAAARRQLNLPKHQLSHQPGGATPEDVARVLQQEMTIAKVLASSRQTQDLVPTWQDIDVLESMHEALSHRFPL
ncbi:hypothetical protein PAMP_005005 [Pampus punctatissimus]